MKAQDIKYFSFPLSEDIHKQVKVVVSANGLTLRNLFEALTLEYLGREENKKILVGLK